MITRFILVALLAVPSSLGGSPWDRAPEKWDQADVYRILQDSPWSPAGVKLDTKFTSRHTDPQTGLVTDAPVNPNNTNTVPSLEIGRSKPQPPVPVLWWSSKTIRLAQGRLRQLRTSAPPAERLRADDLPDYILVIEGSRFAFFAMPRRTCTTRFSLSSQAAGRSILEACAFSKERNRKKRASSFISLGKLMAMRRSIRMPSASCSTAKLQLRCLVPAMTMRSLFALNSNREPCAFTVCPTCETAISDSLMRGGRVSQVARDFIRAQIVPGLLVANEEKSEIRHGAAIT